jgi:hypothetical protein
MELHIDKPIVWINVLYYINSCLYKTLVIKFSF